MGGVTAGVSASRAFLSSRRDLDHVVPRELVVGDALFDPGHELRGVGLHHLPDARPKFVEDVDPRVAANCRSKIVECRRSGARPIWTVSRGDSDRSQHSEEIRSVQLPLPGVVTRDKNARNCVCGPSHNALAGRRIITWVLLEQRRIQVLTKKGAGLFLNERDSINSGKARLRSGSEMFQFGFAHYARVDSHRAKYQRRACFIDERLKFLRLSWRLERRSIGKGFPRTHLLALRFD